MSTCTSCGNIEGFTDDTPVHTVTKQQVQPQASPKREFNKDYPYLCETLPVQECIYTAQGVLVCRQVAPTQVKQ